MKKEFAKRLGSALEEVSAAENDIVQLLQRVRVAPRAEKTTISEALEQALSRLEVARKELLALQRAAKAG